MILRFVADVLSVDEGKLFITLGLSSQQTHDYVLLARSLPLGEKNDAGIYLEFNDQTNSGYDQIAGCALSGPTLRVVLAVPVDLARRVEAIEMALSIEKTALQTLAATLKRIFAGRENLLAVEDV